MEACLLPYELAKLDPTQGAFLVHLGDIRDGKRDPRTNVLRDCPESMFQQLSRIFESSNLTTFFLPGDNAWLDCPNATEAYEFWEKYLFRYNERDDRNEFTVHRWDTLPFQSKERPQRTTRRSALFSFLLDNVLFVGLSLPDSSRNKDHEWYPLTSLLEDNLEWIRDNLDYHDSTLYGAVVLFGHATTSVNQEFTDGLPEILMDPKYGRPPVVVIEDSHRFETQEEFLDIPNLFRIKQEDTVTPLHVKVDPSVKSNGLRNVFRFDQRCLCSDSHRPTEIVRYDGFHPCFDVCRVGIEACEGQNRCSPEGNTCD